MTHLKLLLNYSFNCSCQLLLTNQTAFSAIDKYLLIFTYAAISKEDFLNCNNHEEFSYRSVSCLTYLVHSCQETSGVQVTLLSAYNKTSYQSSAAQRDSSSPTPTCKKSNNSLCPNGGNRYLVLKDPEVCGPTMSTSPVANITINTKPFSYMASESVSYLKPHALIRICELSFEISRQEAKQNNICYDHLAKLLEFDISRITLRKKLEIISSLLEPSPRVFTGLKRPVKIALPLTYKVKHVLMHYI